MEVKKQILQVSCEKHPEQFVSKFCTKRQVLICNSCFNENYFDHVKDCKDVFIDNIDDYMRKYQPLITYFKDKLIDLDQSITSFMRHEK